ncbi:hypothetical protein VT25_01300 [Photobacterium leiognathi subsp. mandapamensis]|nr:hypothetical protein VT25_01300 [Photobacterium leiognathi subsp. mandapamensis]
MKKNILSTIIITVLAPSAMAFDANPETGNMTFTREIRAVSGVVITKNTGSILFTNETEDYANAGKFKIVSNIESNSNYVSVETDKSGISAHGDYSPPTITYFVKGAGSVGEFEQNLEVDINKEYEVIPQVDKYESELMEGQAKIVTTIRLVAPKL